MQLVTFIFTQENMNASMFYVKRTPGVQTRVPPADSDDSCLSESGDSDDEYIPAPGDENSSNNAMILHRVSAFVLLASYLWMSLSEHVVYT